MVLNELPFSANVAEHLAHEQTEKKELPKGDTYFVSPLLNPSQSKTLNNFHATRILLPQWCTDIAINFKNRIKF